MILKISLRKLKIFLIAIGIYYLLILFLFLVIYPSYRSNPGDPLCGLLLGNYDGLLGSFIYWFANAGELPCVIVASGELLLKPITIFFESGWLFGGADLVEWIVMTAMYALVFFAAYKLLFFIRNKRKNAKSSY